ncbi:LPS assembly outer membrane protein LptD (organic solvent tolerance protein OstA) [Sphingobacterium nematocida]|uniref:LPS assembly outer membrane protein LptD (Organic solvent tolerance protein OstA) n=1 Tax=Sphingobacterium nematocida TaxID=1513896 RepID=A0A1T5CA22_9SPHI|nr:LPS assembly outer membrane protein LptD (organic solvent tolerance protein OstA) [Sphingobacterium nematocida]
METLTRILLLSVFLLLGTAAVFSQVTPTKPISTNVKDTSLVTKDTTKNHLKGKSGQDTVVMKTDSGLETVVTIVANDSSWNEVSKNIIHLYKGAKVKYQEFELSADYIRLDRNTNILFASGVVDHNGKYVGRPVVLFPNDTPKAVDSLRYNYKSQEGKTFGIMTEVDGGFIQAKILRKNLYDEMSIHKALYSTCNLPEPHTHFGIHITKGVVTDKQIIAGPSYLVVQGIPMKFLALPFGFFPKQDKKSSGFLFPSFGDDVARGFGLRDLGWYLTFNDYWDSEIRGSFYSKGSWESSIRTNYLVNYKYSGGFNIRYASTKVGTEGASNYGSNKDFNVTWNHTQRQEANPGTSFSASVNFGTASYFQNTGANSTYDYDQLTRNNMSSSISYGKVFADGKVNFTSSLSHRQDMASGKVDLELPTFALNVSTFNPFDSKERVGEQKWYQRITVGYSLQGRNSISTGDSVLFTKQALKQFTNGFQHNIPVSLSLNAFKFFQFNTSVNYTERWYLQTIRKALDNEINGYIDTRDTISGFRRAYDYSFSSGLSTKVYGRYPKIGKIDAVRHVVTPSINFNYRPDFSDPRYGFYKSYIDQSGRLSEYSIFDGAIFGGPSSGKSMGIGFSVDNNIEAKIRTENDTTGKGFKKIPILQGLTFSGNYNFAADSLKLSTISFSGRTTLFNEKINLNFNGTFDPYQLDYRGQRIDKFAVQDGKLARLTNFGLSFDYSFNPDASKSRNGNIDSMRNSMPNMTKEQSEALARISTDPNAFVDFNIPWNLAGSFSFQHFKRFDSVVRRERSDYSATLSLHGDVNVTPKWKIQFNSGYDFKQKEVSMTRFSIYRDLHCWDMSVGWVPFGRYQSYNITIRAKASVLQDLKLTKRNSHYTY